MTRRCRWLCPVWAPLVLLSLIAAGCGSQGDLGGSVPDASISPDGAQDDGPPFALPVYRIGPRSAFQGAFGQDPIHGTIEIPLAAGVTSFSDWTFSGHGLVSGAAQAMGEAQQVGGRLLAELTIEIDTAFSAPAEAREIITATSPGGIVLTAVLAADRTIEFSPESTARNALALAGVREAAEPFFEVYYTGLRAGDDPAIDAAVPSVAGAIESRLSGPGDSGVLPGGTARFGTGVFEALDAAIGDGPAPIVDPPGCRMCLGTVSLPSAGGQVAVFGDSGPMPHMPAATDQLSFFFYTVPLTGDLYLRQRLADGGQSPASAGFQVEEDEIEPPAGLTLTLEEGGARACGADPGNWVVFFASGTELAVGFVTLKATETCVFLPGDQIHEDVGLLTAMQVAPDRRISPPSETVFP
jgi:hypothetical protein